VRIDEAWVADDLPRLQVVHQGFDWPVDGLDPFALDHDATALLQWARSRPSRGYLGPLSEVDLRSRDRAIPMGYTTLAELEKVAIADRGRLLRVWPHGPRDTHGDTLQPYQLVLPPAGRGYLGLGARWPFRYALDDAVDLSDRTGGPVLVCRVLGHIDWQ
jgi:hypothetical protein